MNGHDSDNLAVEFAAFRAEMRASLAEVRAGVTELRPMLLDRSAQRLELEGMKREQEAHRQKHNEHFERYRALETSMSKLSTDFQERIASVAKIATDRMQRIEQRQNRIFWMFLGASSALQAVFVLASWLFANGFFRVGQIG